jgi:hypothetical protein
MRSDSEGHFVPIKNYLPDFPGGDPMDPSGSPKLGPVKRWLYGVVVPAVPAWLGIRCLRAGRIAWKSLALKDGAVTAAAVFWFAIAGLLHFHFFWAPHPKLWRLAEAGKAASLLAFIGALAALAYHILL